MKLPIPKIALPSLPFLGGRGSKDPPPPDPFAPHEGEAEDGAEGAEESSDEEGVGSPDPVANAPFPIAEEKPKSGLGRLLLLVALAVITLGGTGAVVGWLAANGKKTIAIRDATQPQVSVGIRPDGAEFPPNSSLDRTRRLLTELGVSTDSLPEPEVLEPDPEELAEAEEEQKKEGMAALYDPALAEESDKGILPMIAPDGRQPWIEYARSFSTDQDRPRVAVIISRLGLSQELTEAAIDALPAEVTLSFAIYADDLVPWLVRAKERGHEIMIDVPMEPTDYPRSDPGPQTLLATAGQTENLQRLRTVMSSGAGYVGLVSDMGSRLLSEEKALRPILDEIKQRGLMFVDSRSSSRSIAIDIANEIQLPKAFADRMVDTLLTARDIDRRLADIERIARTTGYAVALAQPYPLTIDRLRPWIAGLKARGFDLAPVTAVADKQITR